MPDLFEIHFDPDPVEGTAYSVRPPMPDELPSWNESYKRTPEPMVYLTISGRFRVVLSWKDSEGRWRQKVQRVNTIGQARRLRQWWKQCGRS